MHYLKLSIFSFLLALMFFHPSKIKAQTELEQGNINFSLGYGIPNFAKVGLAAQYATFFDLYSYTYTTKGIVGPISFKGEYMVMDKLGAGISVNFVKASLTYPYSPSQTFTETVSKLNFLIRGNYHFVTTDVLDIYTGLGFGYNGIFRNRTTSPLPDYNYIHSGNLPVYNKSPFTGEISIGLKLFVTDNFGFYTEIGIAKAIFQLGVCVKI